VTQDKGGWVYIMASQPNGVLYVGVTADLVRRVYEHREGIIEGFTKKYGLKWLVWFERHEEIAAAIKREKAIKKWPQRAWRVRLIVAENPAWEDLYERIV
jgi:putative endonuclease